MHGADEVRVGARELTEAAVVDDDARARRPARRPPAAGPAPRRSRAHELGRPRRGRAARRRSPASARRPSAAPASRHTRSASSRVPPADERVERQAREQLVAARREAEGDHLVAQPVQLGRPAAARARGGSRWPGSPPARAWRGACGRRWGAGRTRSATSATVTSVAGTLGDRSGRCGSGCRRPGLPTARDRGPRTFPPGVTSARDSTVRGLHL